MRPIAVALLLGVSAQYFDPQVRDPLSPGGTSGPELLRLSTQDGVEQRLKAVLDPKLSMEERETAVKGLARSKAGGEAILKLVETGEFPPELKATAAFACAASPDADVKSRAAEKLPLPKSKEGTALPPLAELLKKKGDAAAGARVYRNAQGGPNCISCHPIGEEGRQVGPPLSTVANKLSREQLFESILTPSAAILMGYENWVVRTRDGDIKAGIKAEETDDRITLKDTNGRYIDIPVAKIAGKKQLSLSMMPEDITKSMTVQDLVDLVEYLTQQK